MRHLHPHPPLVIRVRQNPKNSGVIRSVKLPPDRTVSLPVTFDWRTQGGQFLDGALYLCSIHSNYGPVSYHFRNSQWFWSKRKNLLYWTTSITVEILRRSLHLKT